MPVATIALLARGSAVTCTLLCVKSGSDPVVAPARQVPPRSRRPRLAIFSGMLLFAAGNALAVPNRLTITGALHLAAGITAQVILVEEPHLRRQHGDRYTHYAATSGRFLPRSTGRNPR